MKIAMMPSPRAWGTKTSVCGGTQPLALGRKRGGVWEFWVTETLKLHSRGWCAALAGAGVGFIVYHARLGATARAQKHMALKRGRTGMAMPFYTRPVLPTINNDLGEALNPKP